MLSVAVTGCNNKNNISEESIKTEAVQPEGNNQSEEGSESDVMTCRQIFMLSHR